MKANFASPSRILIYRELPRGQRVDTKDKPEVPQQANQSATDKSKFNWVTECSNCSLPKVFQTLRSQVEDDVKTRNTLRPANSPYEFSVVATGCDFSVVFVAGDVRSSVVFVLADHGILVRGGEGNQMFEITLNFTPEGQCKLIVDNQQRDFWQVRRMALEELLFSSHQSRRAAATSART
jgi:hypothetical protein